MVEARGVETRRLFAPYGEPAHLFVFLNFRFSAAHTKMHCHEAFVSRPVPSKEGGGGGRGALVPRPPPDAFAHAEFFAKTHLSFGQSDCQPS